MWFVELGENLFLSGRFQMNKTIVIISCFILFLSPAYGKQKKKAPKESATGTEETASQDVISKDLLDVKVFSPEEKEIIKKYYQKQDLDVLGDDKGKKKKLPPGLKKKVAAGGSLPPGWEKKVARGEVLDGEVYQNAEHLPPEIMKQLPKQPQDTVVIRVEGKIIRLLKATRTILDVLDL
jgi:hypothetical protein